HAESRMKLQHAVTRVLAEADPMEPTVRKIMEIIGSGLESQYAGFWIVDRSTRTLHCVELWHASEENLRAFAALSRTQSYRVGVGLPGRVLAEGQPIFINDADAFDSENHPRRELALRAGIKSGSAFP